jgi:preprotein translocase subunit SecG
MEQVVLVIHLMLALGIIALVLLQRSEGGGLGVGGGGGGMGNLAGAHSTANILTRTTGIFAGCFFCTSLLLAILAGTHSQPRSILADLESPMAAITVPSDDEPLPVQTEGAPLRPSVPVEE